jgi:predicted NBD/HSP70 family sugar kinase
MELSRAVRSRFSGRLSDDLLAITRIVRDRGPISRAEIARLLHMSPSTVGRAVDTLAATGVLLERGQAPGNSPGRPSISLQFNPEIGSVLTVDLRLTEAYAAVTDYCGQLKTSAARQLSVDNTQHSLPDLVDLINSLISEMRGKLPISSLVVGAPSLVNIHEGEIEWAPSLGWDHLPLRSILEEEFNLPALIENDVNLAALGEFWKGGGQSVHENMVFVSVGTGIGAGVIINRKLYRGSTYAAGEVAYFITDVNVLKDNAMHIGNLESRVGREGLIRIAQLVAQRYPASQLAELLSRQRGTIKTREIMQLAEKGDQAALVVFNELVDTLTIVICNISVMLDPEMIVLGGPSNWNWSRLIEAIQNRIGATLLRPVNLMPSKLGNDALIMGGAYIALERVTLL